MRTIEGEFNMSLETNIGDSITNMIDGKTKFSIAMNSEAYIKGVSSIIYKLLEGERYCTTLEEVYEFTNKLISYLIKLKINSFADVDWNILIDWDIKTDDAGKKYIVLNFHRDYPLYEHIVIDRKEVEILEHWHKKDIGKKEEFYKTGIADIDRWNKIYDLLFLGAYIYAKL